MEGGNSEFLKYAKWLNQTVKTNEDIKKKMFSAVGKNGMLQILGHVKQGQFGDNNTAIPGMLAIQDKMIMTAWNKLKGMPKDQAQTKFVELVKAAMAKAGLSL